MVVAELDDIPEKSNRAFDVEGRDVLICRSPAGIFAVRNLCSHAGSKLEGGIVKGHYLYCPDHGARFDLRDGSTKGSLTRKSIPTYEVRVVDGRVEIKID